MISEELKEKAKQKNGLEHYIPHLFECHHHTPSSSGSRSPSEPKVHAPSFQETRKLSWEERKKINKEWQVAKKAAKEEAKRRVRSKVSGGKDHDMPSTLQHAPSSPTMQPSEMGAPIDDPDAEAAIQRSIAHTSKGNASEDQVLERALRASLMTLQKSPPNGDESHDKEVIERAVQASIQEANRARDEVGQKPDAEYDRTLELAIRQSLQEHEIHSDERIPHEADWHDDEGSGEFSWERDERDQSYKQALEESKSHPQPAPHNEDDDKDLKLALEESKSHPPPVPHRDDEEELRRALEESKLHGSHDDDEIAKAIEASKAEHAARSSGSSEDEIAKAIEASKREHDEREQKRQTEEAAMLEEVKKRSLAEQNSRQQVSDQAVGRSGVGGGESSGGAGGA